MGVGGKPRSGGQRLRLHYNQPNGIHWCHFHLHISHKAVKSMAKLISQSCGELQPAVCLSRGYGATRRRPVHSAKWHPLVSFSPPHITQSS